MSRFSRTASEVCWSGSIIRAGVERFRHEDGEEVTREKVWHAGAVGIVAIDDRHVWLTRQPREAVGDPASLEIPAGKRDVDGEPLLATAQRELAEEIGKTARDWREIASFYTSPGFSDERVSVYLAEGLADAGEQAGPEENERIEIVPWPLDDLPGAVAACADSKSLIGLLWLMAARAG